MMNLNKTTSKVILYFFFSCILMGCTNSNKNQITGCYQSVDENWFINDSIIFHKNGIYAGTFGYLNHLKDTSIVLNSHFLKLLKDPDSRMTLKCRKANDTLIIYEYPGFLFSDSLRYKNLVFVKKDSCITNDKVFNVLEFIRARKKKPDERLFGTWVSKDSTFYTFLKQDSINGGFGRNKDLIKNILQIGNIKLENAFVRKVSFATDQNSLFHSGIFMTIVNLNYEIIGDSLIISEQSPYYLFKALRLGKIEGYYISDDQNILEKVKKIDQLPSFMSKR